MQWNIPESDEQNRLKQFEDAIHGLAKQHMERRRDALIDKSQQAAHSAEEKDELRQLYLAAD